jgi:hypothetical protein
MRIEVNLSPAIVLGMLWCMLSSHINFTSWDIFWVFVMGVLCIVPVTFSCHD